MVHVALVEYLGSFCTLLDFMYFVQDLSKKVCGFVHNTMFLSKQPAFVCLCPSPIHCTLHDVQACLKCRSVHCLHSAAGGADAEYSIRSCVFIVYYAMFIIII